MTKNLYQVKFKTFEDLVLLQDLYPFFENFNEIPFVLIDENNIVNAYWMSELCRLVYFNDLSFIEQTLKEVNMNVEVFFKNDTEIMVCYDSEKLIIVCRGTESNSSRDIITNLNFFRSRSVMVGDVHGGFKNALDVVWEDLKVFIDNNRSKRKVYITGHSLGAGIASIIASRVHANALYTFGSPRIGNTQFSLAMDMKLPHHRYVTPGDPIPSLPPPLIKWSHFGKKIEIESDVYVFDEEKNIISSLLLKSKTRQKYVIIFTLLMFGYSLAKRLFLDLAAEHNILSYNFSFRRQLGLPPQILDISRVK